MLKQGLYQKQQQKLSPLQIQFIKLLQLTTVDFLQRIDLEMIENPALLSNKDADALPSEDPKSETQENDEYEKDSSVDDYLASESFDVKEYVNDEYEPDGFHLSDEGNEERKDSPIADTSTFHDALLEQFSAVVVSEKEEIIGNQIIGTIDDDGYLRRPLEAIINDLAFAQNIETDLAEMKHVLAKIQKLDPPGIGATSLQQCLIIQLQRKDYYNRAIELAIEVLEKYFEEFTKKHYEKIARELHLDDEKIKSIIGIITKLNPKPGDSYGGQAAQYITPDFTLNDEGGVLSISLNGRNTPDLRISRTYMDALKAYDKSDAPTKEQKDTVMYIKQKLDGAKWFIDSIKQRQNTLLTTMNAILQYQHKYFEDGDDSKLKPMILKTIADMTGYDISTISRVANSKYIQTSWGIISLKYFFSEGITNDDGEEVSSREVKKILKEAIDVEDKHKPLPDEKLMEILKEKGYNIARRTVAKYREQLNLPVARLRKEL
ncbi:MAG: RNA polymerase factor sigma-54 [Bacteroidia bacterium]|nr:RNA polymerase factor sigma-54 [Bacteroidia bacterium]